LRDTILTKLSPIIMSRHPMFFIVFYQSRGNSISDKKDYKINFISKNTNLVLKSEVCYHVIGYDLKQVSYEVLNHQGISD